MSDCRQAMDLLVLFILHSTNANQSRRGAERLLKVKVRAGLMQEALLHRTFRDFAQVGLPASIPPPKPLDPGTGETTVVSFSAALTRGVDGSGHARLLSLHLGPCSGSAALPRPLHGAFWRTHVPPLLQCLRLLLPAGGALSVCLSVCQSIYRNLLDLFKNTFK